MKYLITILMLLLVGCGKVTQEIVGDSKLDTTKCAVVIGDSIANFISSATDSNGNKYLDCELGITSINHGHNGYGTWEIIPLWYREAIELRPKYIILNIGTKDCNVSYNRTIDNIKENFITFAQTAKDADIPLYVNNVAPADFYTGPTNARIAELNEWLKVTMPSYGATVIDMHAFAEGLPDKLKPEYYSDGIHPNNLGCKEASKYIKSYIGVI